MEFTYLLGPVKIALRPRVVTKDQMRAVMQYGNKLWSDCLELEKQEDQKKAINQFGPYRHTDTTWQKSSY